MTQKSKKALNITVNVIVSIIVIFVLILTINIIVSGKKGYTKLFGYTYVAVRSDSMDGDQPDSFKKGDLLKVKVLSDAEKQELKKDDIITFYYPVSKSVPGAKYIVIDGKPHIINSHRIERVEGDRIFTRGDKEGAPLDLGNRQYSDIIGKVVSHTDGLGNVSMWFQSQWGFFVCVVLPSLLIVVYCVFNLVRVVRERNKENAADKEEQLKQQLLEQLRAEGKLAAEPAAPVAPVVQPTESAPPVPVEQVSVTPAPAEEKKEMSVSEEPSAASEEEKASKPAAKKAPAKKKQPIILSAEGEETPAPSEEKKETASKPAAKKAPAKKKQPIILSAEGEETPAPSEEKKETASKPAAKKAPAKKKQPIILSAEGEESSDGKK